MSKNYILAGILATITLTDAFGAASVRMGATSNGGTLTSARAGSLRITPSSKSVSGVSSNPSSVNTTVPSQNTNARLSFVSSVKGLDINQAKENTTTKQELNNLGEKIEQLRTQLDAAENEKASTVKLEDVERKITEKIASSDELVKASDVYTKAEIKKMLPTLDDRGNLTWTDPNGNLVTNSIYYINLVYTVDIKPYNNSPTSSGTFYMYETNKTDAAIQQYIQSTVCNGETSNWCWINDMNPNSYINDGRAVSVIRLNHGHGLAAMPIYWPSDPTSPFYNPEHADTTHSLYWTFEASPETYVRNAVCGNRPESECFVPSGDMQAFNGTIANGQKFPVYGHSGIFIEIVERGQHTGNNFNSSVTANSMTGLTYNYQVSTAANVTDAQIYEYVNNFCNGDSDWWCYISGSINTLASGTRSFKLVKRYPGYGLIDSHIIHDDGEILFNKIFSTNEQNPDRYIHDTICKNKTVSECYIAEWWDMIPINNNIQPGMGDMGDRYQVSVIEKSVTPGSGTSTPGYIPLR